MFGSYLKTAFRNLYQDRATGLLNVFGLTAGIAAAGLILLFVQDEFSFDRYHDEAANIYRVYMDRTTGHEVIHWARTPAPLGPLISDNVPEVRATVRIRKNPRTDLVRAGDREFYEGRFYFADPKVFEVFRFPLKRGNPQTALAEPRSVVITEAMARKYFGEEDAVGQVLNFENAVDMTVTGILEDVPANSHFVFDFLGSFETLRETLGEQRFEAWPWVDHHTYLLLREGQDPPAVEKKLEKLVADSTPARFAASTVLRLQPLTDIHLHSKLKDEITPNSDVSYSYILASVAFFVLLLACVNFVNLSTARSLKRAREVGVRKVFGASRGQLARQYLGESMIVSLIASVLAGLLIALVLPTFGSLAGKDLHLATNVPFVLLLFVGIAILVGLGAGSYPALFLSGITPTRVLNESSAGGRRSGAFRRILVVFQFVVSVVLIVGTLVISSQLEYFTHTTLGFDGERIMIMPARDRAGLRENLAPLKDALERNPHIMAVTAASSTPGTETQITLRFRADGMDEPIQLPTILADVDFAHTYGLEFVAGRDFSERSPSDSVGALIINEQAARHFGFDSAVGQQIEFGGPTTVVGVVRNFQFQSLRHPVEPLVLAQASFFRFLAVKIRPEDVDATISFVGGVWRDYFPDRPFEYSFLDDSMAEQYRSEAGLARVFGYFSALGILIAALGLFALASFTAEQRTREIGLRKTLGASTAGILLMVASDFGRLIALSFVLAVPLAYFLMGWWLQGFANRVALSPAIFLLAGLAVVSVAAVSVGYQSARAALTNPVDSLRVRG
jgi:putative ABC transport system permease protein